MTSWSELEQQVEHRAAERCEYCRMHQSLQGATFHLEHIIPRSLAWACPSCNLHKSDRIEVSAPDIGEMTRLFNPRTDNWQDSFRWEGYHITGLTPVGRVTVAALRLNHDRRIKIRQAEELFDLFPPKDDR